MVKEDDQVLLIARLAGQLLPGVGDAEGDGGHTHTPSSLLTVVRLLLVILRVGPASLISLQELIMIFSQTVILSGDLCLCSAETCPVSST